MKKFIIPFMLLITLFLSGCFALAEPEAASGTVDAPTLAAPESQEQGEEEATPILQPAAEEQEAESTDPYPAQEAPALDAYPAENSYPAPEARADSGPDEAYPAGETDQAPDQQQPPADYPAPETGADSEAEAADNSAVYEIDPARSEARFTINEVLRGTPTTVIGVSSNLGGQIALDLNNPAAAQVGTILINARDFATDNEFRNNAIANEILLTNEHEFITFEPKSISGLPAAAAVGETYPLQITGDLTIIGQTREVTFDAEVTPLNESELQGLARLDILYADFGLTIPFARSVESVEDNVLLELDFIAAK